MTYSRFFQRVLLVWVLLVLASCSTLSSLIEPFEEPTDEPIASEKTRDDINPSQEKLDTAAADPALLDAGRLKLLKSIGPNPFLQNKNASPQATAAFGTGVQAMQAENWQQANKIFMTLSAQYTQFSGPHLNLGIIARKRGDESSAEQHFDSAIKINKANQEAYNQRALLQKDQGRFSDAEASYLQAIEVWPGSPEIRRNLGILYEMYMGELAAAVEQYQACQALLAEPDKQMIGWVKDLQRRIAKAES